MKKVIKYRSEDGAIFDTEAEAKKQDVIFKAIQKAVLLIKPSEFDTCSFTNGEGYIQLLTTTYNEFINQYRIIVKEYEPELLSMFDKSPRGIIGRYFSDSGSPIYTLYNLYICIDYHKRLWGQPYYANNPKEGKQIQLAKV